MAKQHHCSTVDDRETKDTFLGDFEIVDAETTHSNHNLEYFDFEEEHSDEEMPLPSFFKTGNPGEEFTEAVSIILQIILNFMFMYLRCKLPTKTTQFL